MSDHDEEITLEEAAKLVQIEPYSIFHCRGKIHEFREVPDSEHPANQPGAEATAVLETMLAASRKGKVVRGG